MAKLSIIFHYFFSFKVKIKHALIYIMVQRSEFGLNLEGKKSES